MVGGQKTSSENNTIYFGWWSNRVSNVAYRYHASPLPFNLVQPDGSYGTVVAHGDETDNWVTDLDGKPNYIQNFLREKLSFE
jgi:hypothetical protein